jgi:hypothetical protein
MMHILVPYTTNHKTKHKNTKSVIQSSLHIKPTKGRNTSFHINTQYTMAPQTQQAKPRHRRFHHSSNSDVMERGETDEEENDEPDQKDPIEPILLAYSSNKAALLPPTQSLPLLVFIDMFAVSLVVPLLFQYYKNAGVTSANQRELLSSVFSSSQIVGGLVLGAMTDAQLLKRKTILFLSFGGSSVAYALIVYGGFHALIVSRVLVGLVKQTMTVTTSMLTKCTTPDNRAKYMGRYVIYYTALHSTPLYCTLLYNGVGCTCLQVRQDAS